MIDLDREADGKRRQVTRSFAARREAYEWLAGRQKATAVGGPTLGEWLRQWLATRGDLRASTLASYVGHVEKYLVPLIGDQLLGTLTTEDVLALHEQLAAAGVSTTLARRIHATLSSALSAAVNQGVLAVNPAQRVRLPKPQRYQAKVWSAGQASRFLAATRYDAHAALWRLALVLGLRRGELVGLRWADIDLNARTLTITATRVAVGADVVEGPPKSQRGVRVLPLDPATVSLLLAHRDKHVGDAVLVFTDGQGRALRPGWVSKRFADLIEQIGMPKIRFHDLRHTSASLGLAAGESLKEVSQRLGHSSITVTADTYLTLPDTLARESTTRLAGVLDSAWQTPKRRDRKRAA